MMYEEWRTKKQAEIRATHTIQFDKRLQPEARHAAWVREQIVCDQLLAAASNAARGHAEPHAGMA